MLPGIVILVMCIVDACRMGTLVGQVNNIEAMSLKEEVKLLSR